MMLNRKAAAIGLMVIVTFMFLCAGLFLFHEPSVDALPPQKVENQEDSPLVKYKQLDAVIGGHSQKINLLEVSIRAGKADVVPVLSFDRIYGFETLSAMASRKDAYAMVNGGFYYEYGQPSGMVVVDGELVSRSSGKYPVFTVKDGIASMEVVQDELWLSSNESRLSLDGINSPGKPGKMVLYTPAYGQSNRIKEESISVVIESGRVKSIQLISSETKIPPDGMVISLFQPYKLSVKNFPFKPGDRVEFGYEPYLGAAAQAYECGSWIVKDGKVVIGDRDGWVGVLTNRDPRTAIGIKEDGTVLLMTVDGRQAGYSAGLTAKELGEVLLAQGVTHAAMLDGGASTEMILNGKMVNRPSYKGEERPLAGGLMIRYNEMK